MLPGLRDGNLRHRAIGRMGMRRILVRSGLAILAAIMLAASPITIDERATLGLMRAFAVPCAAKPRIALNCLDAKCVIRGTCSVPVLRREEIPSYTPGETRYEILLNQTKWVRGCLKWACGPLSCPPGSVRVGLQCVRRMIGR
jgi:hypothetical protein